MLLLTPPILYSTYQLIKGDKTKTSLVKGLDRSLQKL